MKKTILLMVLICIIMALIVIAVDTDVPQITLNYPDNNTYFSVDWVNFNWTVIDITEWNMTCNLSVGDNIKITINESFNDTPNNYTVAGISDGRYTWHVNCTDNASNLNHSETRNFTIDTLFPTYLTFENNASATQTGKASLINWSINISDGIELNTYGFAHNQSGTLTNVTLSNIGGLYYLANYTLNITLEYGNLICGQFWWNDTIGRTNSTNLSCFTVETTAPTISSLTTSAVTDTGLTVTWTTNEVANSTVLYGVVLTNLNLINITVPRVTSHSVDLGTLLASTQYFYNVSSCDLSGNCIVNGDNEIGTDKARGAAYGIMGEFTDSLMFLVSFFAIFFAVIAGGFVIYLYSQDRLSTKELTTALFIIISVAVLIGMAVIIFSELGAA